MDVSEPQGSNSELDNQIITFQHWLSSNPHSHQDRHKYLLQLVSARWERYSLTNQAEDIDQIVLQLTEAILLPPRPLSESPTIHPMLFYLLAVFLFFRFNLTGHPEDLEYFIEYSRHILNSNLSLEAFHASLIDVTMSLVWALRAHVEIEPRSATQDIEEMVTLCRELLISEVSGDQVIESLEALNEAVSAFKTMLGKTLDRVVEYMQDVIKMYLPGWRASILLAQTLSIRFVQNGSIEDFQRAMGLLDDIITDRPLEGDWRGSGWVRADRSAASLAIFRFQMVSNAENLEDAISRIRNSLTFFSPEDEHHSFLTKKLAMLMKERARYFHLTGEPSQESIHSSPPLTRTTETDSAGSNSRNVPEAYSVVTIEEKQIHDLEGLLSTALPGRSDHFKYLHELADLYRDKFDQSGKISDLEKSIEWRRKELDSVPNGYRFVELRSLHLGLDLLQAFECSDEPAYLEEAISLLHDVLQMPRIQETIRHSTLRALLSGHVERWDLLNLEKDSDEVIHFSKMLIEHEHTIPPEKLTYACGWASIARRIDHSSILSAYEAAMTCLQEILVFAPTLHTQHAQLVSIEGANEVPLEYVSYLVQIGHLEKAVEILEQGRSLLWSEMRGLRISMVQLSIAHLKLASKLTTINRDLEILMTSIPSAMDEDALEVVAKEEQGMDAFGDIFKERRKLLDDRVTLLSQIQSSRGFENFLKPATFDTLRAAASQGPVIIVNHCEYRSDILIVLHDSPPSLIPISNDFYRKANELADRLVDTRKRFPLESTQYRRALSSALKDLYEFVGEPVINRLHELNIPEQSRVWWCPTSVLCSLPLHAMGPIPSNDKVKRYFSDIYISSYTPTLSALIKSREPSAYTSDPPSLFVIAPPDTLPGVREEMAVIKRVLGTSIDRPIFVTSKTTIEGLRRHRFAHFACHGVLTEGNPFDAAFLLRGDDRLTLLDIVRSRLPAAEFALLSACHTAELTDGSVPNEVLHLTAAVQYCGFRSVVGTMWAMADTDGRDLAEHFYKSMFLGKDQSLPHYERSARALQDAVKKLRREKRVSLERWVNFVHYGA